MPSTQIRYLCQEGSHHVQRGDVLRAREDVILIPLMRPCSLASAIKRMSPSITSIKRRGARGQPCLMPLVAMKNFEGVPLTSTTKVADVRQAII